MKPFFCMLFWVFCPYVSALTQIPLINIHKINRGFDTPVCISGKRYILDIDNTICMTQCKDYKHAIPLYKRIQYINDLYELGHEIHYWTSRTNDEKSKWNDFTIKQLNWWGVKYDTLNIGKPSYDYFYDENNAHELDEHSDFNI